MIYVDENGSSLESVDLTRGYLVDLEWIDHPAIRQEGHFEYEELAGGRVQSYVIDVPAQAAWREVTKQKYVLRPVQEEEALKERMAGLEAQMTAYEESYTEGVQEA